MTRLTTALFVPILSLALAAGGVAPVFAQEADEPYAYGAEDLDDDGGNADDIDDESLADDAGEGGDAGDADDETASLGDGADRCEAEFRSFDPTTGTYTTYDGRTVPCPYL